MRSLPFSQSCENNKGPILEVLKTVFADCSGVLEIASGTGQHATWFAGHMAFLRWQPTEVPEAIDILRPRCDEYQGSNLLAPLALDVSKRPWQVGPLPDALFTANSLHIMPWSAVCELFAELAENAPQGMLLAVYGPFNYGGQYTSDSNADFDQWLAQRSPHSAIRDFEKVDALAIDAGFALQEDKAMPANNRLLVWRRR
ncbi:DUF938 domain-containing protein [Pseudohalioglobus lutimaris]|uniref:DUF938 domain-containing protein n=1 Tax=Pseudohalioglobus lutimaris TaxID=1737061 RepID=A0A2N5X8V9_9GAMM|nr:DUF938 domain-containing protein [Pseudohalioglobus lutimaris]PLW70934.1 DUF938 domain-containing protein [Pseudohalioglobus lutimaris]